MDIFPRLATALAFEYNITMTILSASVSDRCRSAGVSAISQIPDGLDRKGERSTTSDSLPGWPETLAFGFRPRLARRMGCYQTRRGTSQI